MKNSNLHIKYLLSKPKEKLTNSEKNKLIDLLIAENKNLIENAKTTSESHSKYKSLFEMSDDALLVIENYQFIDCNQAVVNMLGFKNKGEFLNSHPSELSPELQPDGKPSYLKAQEMMNLALKNGSNHFEWIHTRANGENFPVEVWLSKVELENRILINTIWRDLTQKKNAEQVILKNVKEKEILLKEIHHRVKNNLQIIISLLNLQMNSISDEQTKLILKQSKSRIESMSKIHEMLYKSTDFSTIDFKIYLKELIETLIQNFTGSAKKIKINLDMEKVVLSINTAIPLGLIINELTTNSMKHAFLNISNCEIQIQIKELKNTFEMKYMDNGNGYSYNVGFNNTQTLGFQLISSLVEQLEGNIVRKKVDKGTCYSLTFNAN